MKEAEEQLQALGFGQYEAQAYVSLLRRNPLSGYELAKVSGVPRANIYTVLQKLEERGAVLRLETEAGTRYAPVVPEELIHRLRSRFHSSLENAEQSLCMLQTEDEHDHVWNTRGYPALLEHARALIESTQRQLLLATAPEEAPALTESLEKAQARGVQVTTLCMSGCPVECGACRGRIFRYRIKPERETRYLLVVPDESEVLAGQIGSGEETQAVRTRQKLLVDLSVWHIRNSIAMAALLVDLGDRLEDLLAPETRAALSSLGSGGTQGSWLVHMRQLLNQDQG
jgi:HTH-type transcriptional regulator, sugar sensing transcriptional regulator